MTYELLLTELNEKRYAVINRDELSHIFSVGNPATALANLYIFCDEHNFGLMTGANNATYLL